MNSKVRTLLVAVAVLMMSGVSFAVETFSLTWSEYPSWSTFGVASVTKVIVVDGKYVISPDGELIIDGAVGKMGLVEKKWNIDIDLQEKDYDTCITQYGAGKCDMTCLTNMDILPNCLSVESVTILPTSTSFGADALIVRKSITSVKQLLQERIKTYMLEASVSQYCFARNLEIMGEKEFLYQISNLDPAECGKLMIQGSDQHRSIVVWNPFVLQTLEKQPDCYILFDSTSIPGEIIDMVHMSEKSLAKPGGENAACAIIDAFYIISELLANANHQDDMLVALGEKFSDLDAGSMRKVVRQTRFYSTPEQGISLLTDGVVFPWKRKVASTSSLFTNDGFNPKSEEVTSKKLKDIMPIVVGFCQKYQIVKTDPVIGYGTEKQAPNTQLRFDPTYIQRVVESR